MSERSELRSSREARTENGVKNLKGARPSPKTYCYDQKSISYVTRKKMLTSPYFELTYLIRYVIF